MEYKMEKRDVARYCLVFLILLALIGILFVLRSGGGPTGYGITGFAIYQDSSESDFNGGNYSNTYWNGSAVVLAGENLSGSYISQIFDAGNDAIWNNLSWVSGESDAEFLYCVDGAGDIYKSSNLGVDWIITKDNYGRLASTIDMFESQDYLYILSGSNKEVWRSFDNGISWSVVNDTFSTNSLLVGDSDSNNNLYVATGPGEVYKSADFGVTWDLLSDFNGGTQDAKGIAINSFDDIYIVDGAGDVYSSTNLGLSWTKVNDGYGGSTGTDGMVVDSNNNLYILLNSDVYSSSDSGVTWNKINEDFSPYSNRGMEINVDSNNNLWIADGIGRVFKSINLGIDWNEIGDCNNAATNNPKGLTNFVKQTNLSFQVRTCNDDVCSGESWIYISDTNPQDLSVNNNQYFQYKVNFTSPDSSVSSSLESVEVDYDLVNTAPSINLVFPQEGVSLGYNESIALNFSVLDADENLDSCWYNLNNMENISLVDCQNISFNVSGNGNYDLNLYVNDSENLIESDSVNFNVQLGAPTINLHYPIDLYLNSGNVIFNYTPSDIDLDNCELWGNFSGVFEKNQTDNSPNDGSVNEFNLNLNDGDYFWNIKCNDSLGNFAMNGNKTFYVDTVSPVLSISQPSGDKTSRTGIEFTFSIIDASLINCSYNLTTSVGTPVVSNVIINNCVNTSFNVASDGDYIIYLIVEDYAGHSSVVNSSFNIDNSTSVVNPPIITNPTSSGGGGYFPAMNISVKGELSVSELGNIIARAGDKKSLPLNARNTGKYFLNNCRLKVSGDIISWIYFNQSFGIAPGESTNFIFSLNVPEILDGGDYKGELKVICNEGNDSSNLEISVLDVLKAIQIKEVLQENNKLKIIYDFNNENIIGEEAIVEIWIVDEDGVEVKRIRDVFLINKDGLISREVIIDLPNNLAGIYSVFFALDNDLDDYFKESVVLGKTSGTGFAVFGDITLKNKIFGYLFILIILGIVLFFIIRGYFKKNKKNKRKIKKKKNRGDVSFFR